MFSSPRERGQALIFIVLAIVGLIGITALAIDGGNAFSDRRHAQNAADTAALTGALEKVMDASGDDGDGVNWAGAALTIAAINGYSNGASSTVAALNPPGAGCNGMAGPFAGNSEYVQVIIHSIVDTYFAPVVGIPQVENCVEAIARAKPPRTEEMFLGDAVVGLAPHGCAVLKYQGSASTLVTGSGIFVNSDDPNCALYNDSNNPNDSLVAPGIQVVGGAFVNPLVVQAPITTGVMPYLFPPYYDIPTPTCASDGEVTNQSQTNSTLTPGNYANFPPPTAKKNITLEPGIYCINGTFSANAVNITGYNVLFYLTAGNRFVWNSNSEINVSALNSGPYEDLLVYVNPGDYTGTPDDCIINGASNSSWIGTIYAPFCDIRVEGSGETTGLNSQIIGYTVVLGGGSDTIIHYDDASNYDAPVPPQIELSR